jgi:hypothetical protein
MSAREEKWIMTRMRRETHDQVRLWLKIQDDNYLNGGWPGIRGQARGIVSIDAAVCELLRRDRAHRQRAAKSALKRRMAKRAATNSLTSNEDSETTCQPG